MLSKALEADFSRLHRVATSVAVRMARKFKPCRRYIDRDDFMQECLVALCEALRCHRAGRGPLEQFAARVCERRCIDAFRRVVGRPGRSRYAGLTGTCGLVSDELPQLAKDCHRQRRCDLSYEAEDRLRPHPARERAAVRLYFIDGLTMRQTGFVLGISESRVSQLFSGMREGHGTVHA